MERLVVETATRTWRGQWQEEVDIPDLLSALLGDGQGTDSRLVRIENPVHSENDIPVVYIPYNQTTAIYKEIQ